MPPAANKKFRKHILLQVSEEVFQLIEKKTTLYKHHNWKKTNDKSVYVWLESENSSPPLPMENWRDDFPEGRILLNRRVELLSEARETE